MMKSKLSTCLLTIIIAMILAHTASANTIQREVTLYVDSKLAIVNGELEMLETPPYITNDITMVPLRLICTALNAEVRWDQHSNEVVIIIENHNIKVLPGKSQVMVNNETRFLQNPACVKNKTTFVPLRFIDETLGCSVVWDEKDRAIIITTHYYQDQDAGYEFAQPAALSLAG